METLALSIKLLVTWNICHWAADYTHLSMPFMLKAKRIGKPFGPIFIHASVHAWLMCLSGLAVTGYYALVPAIFLIQVITHSFIDWLKGKLNVWFPKLADPSNVFHWYIFGADQLAHQAVIIFQVYITVSIIQYL